PDVTEAAVVTSEANGLADEKRIVAYIVKGVSKDVSVKQIRQFLRQRLPEYMVPSAIIILDKLPLTASGKINYRALQSHELLNAGIEKKYVAPTSGIEVKLSEIGMNLLKIDKMGIEDNFFELGGHSLLATQYISSIRDMLNVEISLRTMFEHPTISELAAIIEQKQVENIGNDLPMISLLRGDGELTDLLKEIEMLPEDEVQKLLNDEQDQVHYNPEN
ncbi:MAG: phosphopantetheine-binding protein, partial [Ignavibacteriales bacterium]